MCWKCFSSEPITDDEWNGRKRSPNEPDDPRKKYYDMLSGRTEFQTPMDQACCAEPCCCMISCVCFPCAISVIRQEVLDHTGGDYSCCQGYAPPGVPGGAESCERNCGTSSCPGCCMFTEAFCCPGASISATRFVLMDHHNLSVSPVDIQIMRFNNCLMWTACICDIMAFFNPDLRDLAHCIQLTADCVFTSTASCMVAQARHEMKYQNSGGSGAPPVAVATPVDAPAAPGEESPLVGKSMDRN